MAINGGFDPREGMYIGSDLAKAIFRAVRNGGRMWYGSGYLWICGKGFTVRLQHARVDFGALARFDIDASVLRRVKNDGYALLNTDTLSVYDERDACTRSSPNEVTQVTYKWEQYMNPAVKDTVGYSYVELEGMECASGILSAAVPGLKCGFTCERIEETHPIARLLTQNEEWRAEAIVFAHDDLGRR